MVNDRHELENISQTILLVLEKYILTTKFFSISFNNISSNAASITNLKIFI